MTRSSWCASTPRRAQPSEITTFRAWHTLHQRFGGCRSYSLRIQGKMRGSVRLSALRASKSKYAQGSSPVACGQELSIGGKHDGVDLCAMRFDDQQTASAFYIPEANGLIPRARGQKVSIRRECQKTRTRMPLKNVCDFASRRVPQAELV